MKRLIWDLRHHLWLLVNVEHAFTWGHFCLEKRLNGYISDGHLRFTSILAKGLGNTREVVWWETPSSHRAGSPTSSSPSWPTTAPQGRKQTGVTWNNHGLHSPSLVLARLWARHYWAVLPGHSNAFRYWVLLGQQLFAMCIVSFFAEWQFKCDSCKNHLPWRRDWVVCEYSKADLKETKHSVTKLLTDISEVLLNSATLKHSVQPTY